MFDFDSSVHSMIAPSTRALEGTTCMQVLSTWAGHSTQSPQCAPEPQPAPPKDRHEDGGKMNTTDVKQGQAQETWAVGPIPF